MVYSPAGITDLFLILVCNSLRASSPIWASEVSLGASAPRGFAVCSRVLARLALLAQIGELARRLRLHGL